MEPSYASGTSTTPLLGDTIGDNLDRTIAAHGDREALVSVHQGLRYTYARVRRGGGAHRRARSSPPGSRRASASASGARTARSGRSSSTRPPRPGSSSSTSTRRTGRRSSSTRCASPAAGCWSRRRRSRPPTTSRWSRRSAPALPELEQVVFLGRDWDEFLAGGGRRGPRASSAAPVGDAVRRPDQHPVHERHDRLPEGRDAQPPQHPQQRLLRRPRAAASPRRDRVCIPVPYYHCFGMVMGNLGCTHARRLHGHPGARVRRRGDAAAPSRRSAARRSTACRRCSSPSSSTRASPSTT